MPRNQLISMILEFHGSNGPSFLHTGGVPTLCDTTSAAAPTQILEVAPVADKRTNEANKKVKK